MSDTSPEGFPLVTLTIPINLLKSARDAASFRAHNIRSNITKQTSWRPSEIAMASVEADYLDQFIAVVDAARRQREADDLTERREAKKQ